VLGAIGDMEKLVTGADPTDTEFICSECTATATGGRTDFEQFHFRCRYRPVDIRGKVLNQPIYKLLGGAVRRRRQALRESRVVHFAGTVSHPRASRNRTRISHGQDLPAARGRKIEGSATLQGIVACCEAVRAEIGNEHDYALDFHVAPARRWRRRSSGDSTNASTLD